MTNNKFYLAAIVGFVTFFILGWLIYGMILKDTMAAHTLTSGFWKTDAEMQARDFMALILAQLATGFLFALVITYANSTSASSGAKTGAILALLMGIATDFTFYGTANFLDLSGVAIDIICWVITGTIAGAVIGMVLGSGRSKAART